MDPLHPFFHKISQEGCCDGPPGRGVVCVTEQIGSLADQEFLVTFFQGHDPTPLQHFLPHIPQQLTEGWRVSKQACHVVAQPHYDRVSQSRDLQHPGDSVLRLRPCHTIRQHQPPLCISICNLHSEPLSACDDISWAVAARTDEVLGHADSGSHIDGQLLPGYVLDGGQAAAGSTFVQKHRADMLSALQIKSSGVEADALAYHCQPFITALISVIAQIDHGRFLITGPSHSVEEVHAFLLQLISTYHSDAQTQFLSKAFRFLDEVGRRSEVVSPSIGQNRTLDACICQGDDIFSLFGVRVKGDCDSGWWVDSLD